MFTESFEDGSLQDYINQNTKDPWVGTPFEKYVLVGNKIKGEFGERFVHKYMESKGHDVKRAKTSTAGHDRVIDGIRTEIKFSLAIRKKDKNGVIIGVTKDKFIINHLACGKDWERFIFCGINPNEDDIRIFYILKADFEAYLKSDGCLFKVQQGGKDSGNDDYICTEVKDLLECDFVKEISEW
jgi:hypothetical protein|tara:strand:- start:142 stop:693 length:552 start_codon:yes stop_codon:yes gene_type:complete